MAETSAQPSTVNFPPRPLPLLVDNSPFVFEDTIQVVVVAARAQYCARCSDALVKMVGEGKNVIVGRDHANVGDSMSSFLSYSTTTTTTSTQPIYRESYGELCLCKYLFRCIDSFQQFR